MVNRERIKIILSYAKVLELKVHHLKWGIDLLGVHDFRIKIKLFGKEHWGAGVDQDEEVALLKAFSEAIERAYCVKFEISSSGVAAGWDVDQIQKHAQTEIIERDVFLCHYLSKEPIKNFYHEKINQINTQIGPKKTISVYQLSTVNQNYTFMTRGCYGNDGIIIGLGTASEPEKAFEKSLEECLFRFIPDYHTDQKKESLLCKNSNDHKLFHRFNSNSPELEFFKSSDQLKTKDFDYEFQIEELGDLENLYPKLRLKILRVQSPKSQNLFYGSPNNNVINLDRLNEFSERSFLLNELEKIPHPLG